MSHCRQTRGPAKEAARALLSLLALSALIALSALLPARPVLAAPAASVVDTRTGRTIPQTALLDRLAQADVVFVGEQHTDPAAHALELSLLTGLRARAGRRLCLGMEMWERDTQPALDAYLGGKTTEAAFLRAARPWANYQTDYRPLVEYAKANAVPVLATNVPQAVASQVGRRGLAALQDAAPGLAAASVETPSDAAWERFRAVMAGMGGAHGGLAMDAATTRHFYEAQCVRDDTMAESITRRLDVTPGALVLHVNGQFHSDGGDGIPRRVLWRRPLTRIVIVSVVDAANAPRDARAQADYVVLSPAPPTGP